MKTVVEEEERSLGGESLSENFKNERGQISGHMTNHQDEGKKSSKMDGQAPPQQRRTSAFENVIMKVIRRPSVVTLGNLRRGSRSGSHGAIDGKRPDHAEGSRGTSSQSEMSLLLSKVPEKSLTTVPSQLIVRRPSGAVTFNPGQMNLHQKRYILGLLKNGSNNSLPELCRDVTAGQPNPEEPKKSLTNGNEFFELCRTGNSCGRFLDGLRHRGCFNNLLLFYSDAFVTAMATLYGKLLFVLGIAFPVAEVLSSQVPTHYYQGFYLFLYIGSLAFMIFMYMTLLKDRALYKILKSSLDVEKDEFHRMRTLRKSKQILLNPVRYGSFYLRLGAVAFGIGSMVYSGLEFGQYFEVKQNSQCHNLIKAITPVARMILTLAQMQFIFINSRQIEMSRTRGIARFGLVHLVATNLCEWLNVIVEETKHEIIHLGHLNDNTAEGLHGMEKRGTEHDIYECQRASVIGSLVQDASPFLFPCTIEYSLICAVIMYEMWKDVKKAPYKDKINKVDLDEKGPIFQSPTSSNGDVHKSSHHFSVDCSNAHKGLFSGILILVMTIISLIMFFVMAKDPRYHSMADYEVNVCELILYSIGTVAVIAGGWKMRLLQFKTSNRINEGIGLDNTLLMWAQTGVYVYCMFSIIACYFMIDHNAPGGFITEVFSLIQTTCQTAFILDATFRRTDSLEHHKNKPGRQIITFLLVSNMALWLMNTLQKNRAEFRPTHLDFYGIWAWTIITHVSMPLSIFYRFHSTICLFEIWKNAYKLKPPQHM